jgi:antitoxin MazE
MIERVGFIYWALSSSTPLKFFLLLPNAGTMKKDSDKNDKCIGLVKNISNAILRKERMSRAGWGENSKAIARHGDDYLVLGEFPNLEGENLEW